MRLAGNGLHGRRRAGCAGHQTGLLRDRRGRLCARRGNEGGVCNAEGLEGGGRSRCTVVSLLVAAVVLWLELDIPRSAMAVACLVVENMAAIVWECVAGEGVESGVARQSKSSVVESEFGVRGERASISGW